MTRFWREGGEEWNQFKDFGLNPDYRNSTIIF